MPCRLSNVWLQYLCCYLITDTINANTTISATIAHNTTDTITADISLSRGKVTISIQDSIEDSSQHVFISFFHLSYSSILFLSLLPLPLFSLVHFLGFDPLGFTNQIDPKWLREAELKHCRIAMLATLGFVASGFIQLPGEVHQVNNK